MKNLLEDSQNESEIHLANVKSEILEKAIEYCKYYVDNDFHNLLENSPETNEKQIQLNEWNNQFTDQLDQQILIEIMLAANYLDISCLLDACCSQLSKRIKGKSPQEIKKILNIDPNSFEPEDNEQIERDYNYYQYFSNSSNKI